MDIDIELEEDESICSTHTLKPHMNIIFHQGAKYGSYIYLPTLISNLFTKPLLVFIISLPISIVIISIANKKNLIPIMSHKLIITNNKIVEASKTGTNQPYKEREYTRIPLSSIIRTEEETHLFFLTKTTIHKKPQTDIYSRDKSDSDKKEKIITKDGIEEEIITAKI
jgi:hypothetical protein